jgi:aminopeptidase N
MRAFYPSTLVAILLTLLVVSCSQHKDNHLGDGVSRELAIQRKGNISEVVYTLDFSIPDQVDAKIPATMEMEFVLGKKEDVVLDFKPHYTLDNSSLKGVFINGKSCSLLLSGEHMVIPSRFLKTGKNLLNLEFDAGQQSLNRRNELLYTLLVPDRARTLFPCFDQPDLKAVYNLSLEIPLHWEAVANGVATTLTTTQETKRIIFSPTEPISTYLFSFVAGEFQRLSDNRKGREINIWHRESDPLKVGQAGDIFSLIYSSLEWLEDYTAIDYPFTKYDIVIVPGFQYGGMEHMGATLYSDRTMFLEQNATITEELSRAKLVAHETAHMWFGDYVTMEWFDDVWTKEVFANWFASAIVNPLFPQIDHKLNFINSYLPPSYAEDRTPGANAVRQELDNLNNAGLVYGNIIYNKAPVVMDKMVGMIGDSLFQVGIREYLNKFAYGNASWDDLIEILDNHSSFNLKNWSNVWVKEPGRPHLFIAAKGDSFETWEEDPLGRDLSWGKQTLAFDLVPDPKGEVYGLVIPDSALLALTIDNLSKGRVGDDVARLASVINLYELCYDGYLAEMDFLNMAASLLLAERNPIIFSRMAGYLSSVIFEEHNIFTENLLSRLYKESGEQFKRNMAFRAFANVVRSKEGGDELYKAWDNPSGFGYVTPGERDLMRISYTLAILFPEKYEHIGSVQSTRLTSKDRLEEFRWILPSVSPNKEVRDSVFKSLLLEGNRLTEPWAEASLGYLNHPLRSHLSLEYISPALEICGEIHRTGDIFFPARWFSALLSGHSSKEAARLVSDYLEGNDELNPFLEQKILQQSYHLFRK